MAALLYAISGEILSTVAMGSLAVPHPQAAPNSDAVAAAQPLTVIFAILNHMIAGGKWPSQSKNASVRIWVLRFTPREISSRLSSVIMAPFPTR